MNARITSDNVGSRLVTNLFLACLTIIGSLIAWIFLTQRADTMNSISHNSQLIENNAEAIQQVNDSVNKLQSALANESDKRTALADREVNTATHVGRVDDHLSYIDHNQIRILDHLGMDASTR